MNHYMLVGTKLLSHISELSTYLERITFKSMDKVNDYLRIKYLDQQKSLGNIIVTLAGETDDPPPMTIRQSIIRPTQKNIPFEAKRLLE